MKSVSETPATGLTVEATVEESLAQRLARRAIMNVLGRFNRSPIRVHMPDGEQRIIGNPEGGQAAELYIRDPRFFTKALLQGEVGFGEAYVENLWQTDDLTRLLSHFIDNLENLPDMSGSTAKAWTYNLLSWANVLLHKSRRNNRANSRRNISAHYDLSNDFYALWLDRSMTYSSAWFEGSEDLCTAQETKYRRLCDKLALREGMRVLEIGCGWGGFAVYAASNYNVHVTAITISQAQHDYAVERVRKAGLQDRIEIRICDYRDIQGQFDAIASIEMLEAVGHEFLESFFSKCHQLLNATGRMGVQVIICPDNRYDAMRKSVDWIKKHIFPGGQLPSVKVLLDSANRTGDLYMQHLENFGLHYARTLRIWREKFNQQTEQVKLLGFDDEFMRKWNYYLSYCEAAFATRNINVSQIIMSRPNNQDFALEC